MAWDEGDVRWNKVFVWLFSLASVAWLILIPFLTWHMWLMGAVSTFAVFEAIGLRRHRDRLPPLTYITRRYLPDWLTSTLIGFFTGLAGGYWFGFAHPFALAALFGLYSWTMDHFDATYDED